MKSNRLPKAAAENKNRKAEWTTSDMFKLIGELSNEKDAYETWRYRFVMWFGTWIPMLTSLVSGYILFAQVFLFIYCIVRFYFCVKA